MNETTRLVLFVGWPLAGWIGVELGQWVAGLIL
jgi:hypothetical protein